VTDDGMLERRIRRHPRATLRLHAVVREVFRWQVGLADDEQWSPEGTCDSTCEVLHEDGMIYEAFPGAELAMWAGGHPWGDMSGHCFFRLPDGLILDPTIWQFTREPGDWLGAAYYAAAAA